VDIYVTAATLTIQSVSMGCVLHWWHNFNSTLRRHGSAALMAPNEVNGTQRAG